jgi:hypothetical protein
MCGFTSLRLIFNCAAFMAFIEWAASIALPMSGSRKVDAMEIIMGIVTHQNILHLLPLQSCFENSKKSPPPSQYL